MRRLILVDISLFFATIGCCASAHAQSGVTLFGIADAGIEYNNNAGRNGDNLVRLVSGNQSGSRWGLRGVEDLVAG